MVFNKPMGSMFNDFVPAAGTIASEKGKIKQGAKLGIKTGSRMTRDDYEQLKEKNSLAAMAEEKMTTIEQSRSISLPKIEKSTVDKSAIEGLNDRS